MMARCDAPVLRRLSGDDPAAITGTMVAIAATEGDPAALAAMDELGRWLAAGLALVTDVLDPEVIVVGGGVSAAAGMFLPLAVSEFAGLITGAGHRPRAAGRAGPVRRPGRHHRRRAAGAAGSGRRADRPRSD